MEQTAKGEEDKHLQIHIQTRQKEGDKDRDGKGLGGSHKSRGIYIS